MKRSALLVLLIVGSLLPARAASTSCGGLAPLELTCEAVLVPATSSITITTTAGPTFVGLIDVRLSQGSRQQAFPCVKVSVATGECAGTSSGEFQVGQPITVRVEVFSYEGITPSIGDWLVTVAG